MEKELIKQSDSVTFAKYRMSSWQINCLVNIVDNLQSYLDIDIDWGLAEGKEYQQYFKLNKDYEFPVIVQLSKIEKHEHYGEVRKEILKLMSIKIEYDYINDNGDVIHSFLVPFNHIDLPKNCGYVEIKLPIPSLRWILQWCKNTGLTTFDKKSVLSLKGVYAKRIFQILSSFYKERIFKMKIDKLSDILMTPKYSVQDFERFVLRPAFNEMATNQNSRLFFKYKLVSEGKRKGAGRPKRDTVIFKVYDMNTPESVDEFKTDNFENE